MKLATVQYNLNRFIIMSLLMSCLLISPLKAENFHPTTQTYGQHPIASFANYRTLNSPNTLQTANPQQASEPQTASHRLNKQLYANLSSNNSVALVSYETESEDIESAENESEPSPFNEQQTDPSCCLTECNPDVDFTLSEDLHNFFPTLLEDSKQLINWKNGIYLGVALGGSIALRESVDEDVRHNVARHPRRWGNFGQAMEDVGDVKYQIPVLLGVYSYSLYKDDPEFHSFSTSLISAMTINGLSTITIKAIADTDRPLDNYHDGEKGFPSYHTSSMFTFASVIDEYYGHGYGLPAYTLAGLVGWSRIDMQRHDLSDVVFGAALGTIIGKGVAKYRRNKDCNYRVSPYVHPTSGSTGVMFDLKF